MDSIASSAVDSMQLCMKRILNSRSLTIFLLAAGGFFLVSFKVFMWSAMDAHLMLSCDAVIAFFSWNYGPISLTYADALPLGSVETK